MRCQNNGGVPAYHPSLSTDFATQIAAMNWKGNQARCLLVVMPPRSNIPCAKACSRADAELYQERTLEHQQTRVKVLTRATATMTN